MIRGTLAALGILWIFTGLSIFWDPKTFYEVTPGVSLLGPYSPHFLRDVGLVYLASGGTLICAAYQRNRALALAGLAWPVMHSFFHLHVWHHRGFPFDMIFAFDVLAVIAPPLIALALAIRMQNTDG
jgi:hypothetical protein